MTDLLIRIDPDTKVPVGHPFTADNYRDCGGDPAATDVAPFIPLPMPTAPAPFGYAYDCEYVWGALAVQHFWKLRPATADEMNLQLLAQQRKVATQQVLAAVPGEAPNVIE